ncbi:MAG: YwiC-like family protein [Acidimicrobiales bacterium]|nr:YwiC-like family protein [Acidimicrobiales bacterium]
MTTTESSAPESLATTSDPPSRPGRVSWKSVALPTEHGGWSLTAEPALLGLLVAWSWPGVALGVAAMVAFLARTPLKLVLVDRFRRRWLPRTRLAAQIAAVEVLLLAGFVGYAAFAAEPFWLPLAVAAPLVALELWFDMRSRGRRLIPELAGSIGIGSVATAIALADGASTRVAWGLWVVIAARSAAAIPYVRTQVLRTRSSGAPNWHSDAAQLAAAAATTVGWAFDLLPTAALVTIVVLIGVNLVALRLAPKPPAVIGTQQMIFGMAVILTTALALS